MHAIWHHLVPLALVFTIRRRCCGHFDHCKFATISLFESKRPLIHISQDGPATANYDEDLGTLPVTDWYYTPGFEVNEQAQHSRTGPPPPDNILVNGTHINAEGGGKYAKINVVKGKKYRLRLINTSVDSVFSISMDKHPFTVITSDFVPIQPYVTDQITMNIGQRYDVIITANQTVDNYWFRVSIGCGRNNIQASGLQMGAILSYSGAPTANPTSTTNVTMRTTCIDEKPLTPFVSNRVPFSVLPSARELALNSFVNESEHALFRWTLDGSTQVVNWETPSLQTTLEGMSNYGENSNIHEMNNKDGWYLWWIQTTTNVSLPHPIHLHGHDFYVLGSGTGVWEQDNDGLNFDNPTRRDTATLPAGGYLLLAFPADNPGHWVMVCSTFHFPNPALLASIPFFSFFAPSFISCSYPLHLSSFSPTSQHLSVLLSS
jgi:FtsP/CotA-like multicopper oxidase with cupredoxin domain